MTKEQWLSCGDPALMLAFLHGKCTERKWRLFAVACCRRLWHLLKDGRSQRAVEVAERQADGSAGAQEVAAAADDADEAWMDATEDPEAFSEAEQQAAFVPLAVLRADGFEAATSASDVAVAAREWDGGEAAERASHCQLLRDIIPFRTVSLDPAWRAPQVVALAQATYDERRPEGTLDPARLAVLADALEEAGCTEPAVLGHLRGPGPHVRGCHVVDLLLSREGP